MRTVVALYDRIDQAREAIRELTDAGFASEDINLISRDASGEYSRYLNTDRARTGEDVSDGAATGAGIGAVLGGLGGLLLGLGALAIPGIGPVIAAGPIAAALAGAGVGAVTGGLVGALVDLGIPDEHAEYYAEGIRRGGTLVTVRAKDEHAERVRDILNKYDPIDLDKTVSNWRAQNWNRFNPESDPLDVDAMEFNRPTTHMPVTGSMVDDDSQMRRDRDMSDMSDVSMRDSMRDSARDSARDSVRDTSSDFSSQDMGNRDFDTRSRSDREMDADLQEDREFMSDKIPVTGDATPDVVERDMTGMDVDEQGWSRYDMACRRDFMDRFVNSGRDYAYYQPAYRFGYVLGSDERYRDADWDVVEPEARREWDNQSGVPTWDEVKDAVHYAWRTTTGRLMS